MTSKGNWLELARLLVACILGTSTAINLSLCVLVGRYQVLLPPISTSERGQILLPHFIRGAAPTH